MLESVMHADCAFLTLTYDDEHLPEGGTLVPKHAQDWLKRIRRRMEPTPIRFFLVGEYGDSTWRPHYHVALFGVPSCARGQTEHREAYCCHMCRVFSESWGYGGVDAGSLTIKSAQYIAGYVTKKLTKRDDPRLGDRHPEFARMSLKPGLGAYSMEEVASVLKGEYGDKLMINGDVPHSLRHGVKWMPLGRYLRGKLREKVLASRETPEKAIQAYGLQMRFMFQEARKEDWLNEAFNKSGLKGLHLEANKQKIRNVEAREKIFGQQRGAL